jgi:HPt (histidine-containing phosphotransfer) domain-containing protein
MSQMVSWKNLPVLDLGPMREAFGEIDNDAKATLASFLTTTHPLLVKIQMQMFANDLPAAAAAAHSAKGAANVTGAFRLGGLCAEICTQLRLGDEAKAQSLAALLPDIFDEVRVAIHQLGA